MIVALNTHVWVLSKEILLKNISEKVKIAGFRPGKVPMSHVEKLYGKETIVEVIEEKVSALENMDTSHTHNTKHKHDNSAVKVLEKEIELLKLQLEEIKVKASNPLGN